VVARETPDDADRPGGLHPVEPVRERSAKMMFSLRKNSLKPHGDLISTTDPVFWRREAGKELGLA
jgi:hypothetical protein